MELEPMDFQLIEVTDAMSKEKGTISKKIERKLKEYFAKIKDGKDIKSSNKKSK